MAHAKLRKKSVRGTRVCGALGCGKEIQPGENYWTWSFRYGGRQVRCTEHPPKQSDMTQSKMGEVYAAVEEAEVDLVAATTIDDIKDAVQSVSEVAQQVVEEYREAAEHFGGQGENAERADELEGWADELGNFDPDTIGEDEFDEDAVGEALSQEMFGIDDPKALDGDDATKWRAALQEKLEEWDNEHKEITEAVDNARTEAEELLGSCPL